MLSYFGENFQIWFVATLMVVIGVYLFSMTGWSIRKRAGCRIHGWLQYFIGMIAVSCYGLMRTYRRKRRMLQFPHKE